MGLAHRIAEAGNIFVGQDSEVDDDDVPLSVSQRWQLLQQQYAALQTSKTSNTLSNPPGPR